MTAFSTLPCIVSANGLHPSVFVNTHDGVISPLSQSPTTSATAVSGPPFWVTSAEKNNSIRSLTGSKITPGKLNNRFVFPCCSKSIAVAPDDTMLLDTYVTLSHPSPIFTRTNTPSASAVSELFRTVTTKLTTSPFVTIWLLGCKSMSRLGMPG